MRSNTVFLTGATGYLGYHIAECFVEKGYRVIALARKGSDTTFLEKLNVRLVRGDLLEPDSYSFLLNEVFAVLHCAAVHTYLLKEYKEYYDVNVKGTEGLLKAAEKANVSEFIYTSTIRTIGKDPLGRVSTEETPYNLMRYDSAYGITKFKAEQAVLSHTGGMTVKIVNPGIIVGAKDLRPSPVGYLIKQYLDRKIFYYVDTIMNLVHVKDAALAHYLVLTKGKPKKYIISAESYSQKLFFEQLKQISNIRPLLFPIPYIIAYPLSFLFLALGKLTNRQPIVRPDSIRIAKLKVSYDGSSASRELGIKYRSVREALTEAVECLRKK